MWTEGDSVYVYGENISKHGLSFNFSLNYFRNRNVYAQHTVYGTQIL
jgi:hypothetical protein